MISNKEGKEDSSLKLCLLCSFHAAKTLLVEYDPIAHRFLYKKLQPSINSGHAQSLK